MKGKLENNNSKTPEQETLAQDQGNSNSNNASGFFNKTQKPLKLRIVRRVPVYDSKEPINNERIKIDKEGHPYIGRSLEEVYGNKPTPN